MGDHGTLRMCWQRSCGAWHCALGRGAAGGRAGMQPYPPPQSEPQPNGAGGGRHPGVGEEEQRSPCSSSAFCSAQGHQSQEVPLLLLHGHHGACRVSSCGANSTSPPRQRTSAPHLPCKDQTPRWVRTCSRPIPPCQNQEKPPASKGGTRAGRVPSWGTRLVPRLEEQGAVPKPAHGLLGTGTAQKEKNYKF